MEKSFVSQQFINPQPLKGGHKKAVTNNHSRLCPVIVLELFLYLKRVYSENCVN
jgi:hypothetical protein